MKIANDQVPVDRNPVNILLVEDNAGDVRLTEEAFKEGRIANALYVVNDGDEALDFLRRRGDYADAPRTHLVLLDLNLPRKNGDEVLRELRSDPDLEGLSVVILTGTDVRHGFVESSAPDADAYLSKPVTPDDLLETVRGLEPAWLSVVWASDGSK